MTDRDAIADELRYLNERIDELEKDAGGRFWVYGPGCFGGLRLNALPWMGADGNDTYCRRTIVIPLFGLGAVVVGLRWHRAEDCLRADAEGGES